MGVWNGSVDVWAVGALTTTLDTTEYRTLQLGIGAVSTDFLTIQISSDNSNWNSLIDVYPTLATRIGATSYSIQAQNMFICTKYVRIINHGPVITTEGDCYHKIKGFLLIIYNI